MPTTTFTVTIDLKQLKKDFAKDRRMQRRGKEPRTMHEAAIRASSTLAKEMAEIEDAAILKTLHKEALKAKRRKEKL